MKKKHLYITIGFFTAWLTFSSLNGVLSHLNALPSGVHQSAQCDRASLAQNYYYNHLNFLYPEVNENRCIDGIVSCELPLTAFLSATLYTLFGYDEFWFRLLTFSCFSLGMFALFLWFKTKVNSVIAFALVCLVQSSPILMFYSASFLPDVTSLGLSLIAWYLFSRMYLPHPYLPFYKNRIIELVFILCLSFAIASKTTAAIQLLSMLGVIVLSFIPTLNIHILQRKRAIIALAIACIIPIAWYFWSKYLGMTHNSQYFMMRVPIPESFEAYKTAWLIYLANWPQQTFSEPIIYIAFVALLLPIFLKKYISNELYYVSILNLLGSLSFLFLMIDQFKYHDYYIICLIPVFAINWLVLLHLIQSITSKYWYTKILLLIALIWILSVQYNGGTTNLKERYTKGNYWEQSHINAETYDSLRMKLKPLHIDRNNCVVVGVDAAPNNILYFLHLRGHRYSPEHDSARLDHIVNGAHPQYLISNDSLFETKVKQMIDSTSLICKHNNIKVFQLFHTIK